MPRALHPLLLCYSLIGVLLLAPIIRIAYWPEPGGFDVAHYLLGRDFVNIWVGPQIVDRFGVMTLFDLEAYHWAMADVFGLLVQFNNWAYPLPMLFFARAFSAVPYFDALALWTALGLVAYLGVAFALVAREQRSFVTVALLLAPACIVNIVGGQNGFFVGALVLGAIVFWDRRPWFAGVFVGLLTLKPHLGIVVAAAMVATLAWRIALAASLTAAAMIAASWVAYGTEPWLAYLARVPETQWHILTAFEGFQRFMSVSVLASARAFGPSVSVAALSQTVVSLVAVVGTAVFIRRTHDLSLRALLITSGTFLASPYVFNYDMAMLTIATLWVMLRFETGKLAIVVFGAAWILPSATWMLHSSHLGLSPLAYGSTFALACWMIGWRAIPLVQEDGRGTAVATRLPQPV